MQQEHWQEVDFGEKVCALSTCHPETSRWQLRCGLKCDRRGRSCWRSAGFAGTARRQIAPCKSHYFSPATAESATVAGVAASLTAAQFPSSRARLSRVHARAARAMPRTATHCAATPRAARAPRARMARRDAMLCVWYSKSISIRRRSVRAHRVHPASHRAAACMDFL